MHLNSKITAFKLSVRWLLFQLYRFTNLFLASSCGLFKYAGFVFLSTLSPGFYYHTWNENISGVVYELYPQNTEF
jgi:hypothetical protein